MVTELPRWNHTDLVEQIVVAPRTGSVPAADTVLSVGPGWIQVVTPSFRQGGLNEVVHCVLPEGVADPTR